MNKYSKRGKLFEKQIEYSLNKLNNINDGYFIRSPTPIKVINVNYKYGYPIITNAVFEKSALCDFYGIYKKKFILIETKETNENVFNKKMIKPHQIKQLSKIEQLGGVGIIIIHFKKLSTIIGITVSNFLLIQKKINIDTLLKHNGINIDIDGYIIEIKQFFEKII